MLWCTEKAQEKLNANHKVTVAMAEELEVQSIKILPGWK